MRLIAGDVVLELPPGTPAEYVSRLLVVARAAMLTIASGARVYLASQAVDLRRGHDGLCALTSGWPRAAFRLPVTAADTDRVVLDGTELAVLLGGLDLARTRRQPAWKREAA